MHWVKARAFEFHPESMKCVRTVRIECRLRSDGAMFYQNASFESPLKEDVNWHINLEINRCFDKKYLEYQAGGVGRYGVDVFDDDFERRLEASSGTEITPSFLYLKRGRYE